MKFYSGKANETGESITSKIINWNRLDVLKSFISFVTENIYQNLVVSNGLGFESIHLEEYPIVNSNLIDEDLSDKTRLAMRLSSMGRSARSKASVKVRQPLDQLFVKTRTASEMKMIESVSDQIKEELNVKAITLVSDASEIVNFQLQPNLPVLGPRYGSDPGRIRK